MSSDPVETKVRAARIKMLIQQPFFGVLSSRLTIIENNTWCKTMATDGKNLYYNRDFVDAISLEETIFGICHEILHCGFVHFLRQNNRDKDIWNMATDYAINWILNRDQIGKPLKPNPKIGLTGILLDNKYGNMCAEEIYDKLMKSATQVQMPFDCHIYSSGSKSDDGKDGNGSGGKPESGDGPPSISDKAADEISQDFKDAMINAAETASGRQAGSIPAEIVRLVKQLKEPRICWRELIYNNIQSHVKSDCSFMRWSKRSSDTILLPGRMPEDTIKVGVAVDVSGSISQEVMTDFVSEIKGIMDQYSSFSITIWSFDTEIHSVQTFTEDNSEDLLYWTPEGGGGTYIKRNFDFVKENQIDINTLILLTDLEDSSQNSINRNDVPDTVWIIKNSYKPDIEPPFGIWAYID